MDRTCLWHDELLCNLNGRKNGWKPYERQEKVTDVRRALRKQQLRSFEADRRRQKCMERKHEARFPLKRNRLRCVRCVNENRKKRKRLRLNGNRA